MNLVYSENNKFGFEKTLSNALNKAKAKKIEVQNVILYSTRTCPYCKMEKEWLDKNSLKHEVVYLEDNREKARYVVQATGQMGVPVTEVVYAEGSTEFVVGFDKNRLQQILL